MQERLQQIPLFKLPMRQTPGVSHNQEPDTMRYGSCSPFICAVAFGSFSVALNEADGFPDLLIKDSIQISP